MSVVLRALRALGRLGPYGGARKLRERLHQRWLLTRQRAHDRVAHSFGELPARAALPGCLEMPAASTLPGADAVIALAEQYLAHRFDLLGSGWVHVAHGRSCSGVQGVRFPPAQRVDADPAGEWLRPRVSPPCADEAARIWSLVGAPYQPIDWQLDFKSGYRWSARTWFADVRYGEVRGADVKVPWELGRLQHLPLLAWAGALAREGFPGAAPAEHYEREFRAQVLDFIAANPPRWGVGWASPMDVAIRGANLAVAHALFRGWGAEFDAAFERELQRSLGEHARHVADHPEWDPVLRGNHYLTGVAGLLLIARFLPATAETDAWLALAAQELVGETRYQFLDDGGHFERSTAYHRLCAEAVTMASAGLLGAGEERLRGLANAERGRVRAGPGLGRRRIQAYPTGAGGAATPFPASHAELLERGAELALHVQRSPGRAHLLGDDDSGRFLRLWPAAEVITRAQAVQRLGNLDGYDELPADAPWPELRHADQRGLLAAAGELFGRAELAAAGAPAAAEAALVRALSGGVRLRGVRGEAPARGRTAPLATGMPAADGAAQRYRFAAPGGGLRDGLETFAYPQFGVYILRSPRLYLGIRCAGVLRGTLGHAHNDHLAVELCVDGVALATDPGSCLYTPLPEVRERYRGVAAHFAPRVGSGEPARRGPGLFAMEDRSRARCLRFDEEGFLGTHLGYGHPVYREVRVLDDGVEITDWGMGCRVDRHEPPADPPVSDGYGRWLR